MSKNPKPALLSKKNKSGTSGKILSTLLAFLLGIIVGVGGLFGIGYLVLSKYTIKSGVSAVGDIIGSDIDYSKYVTEEYANKTVINAIKDIFSLTQKGTAITLADLNEVSPVAETQAEKLTKLLSENYAVTISVETLMDTPLADYGNLLSESLGDTECGAFLSAPAVDFLKEGTKNYDLLMLVCYGEENVDYDIVNGEVVMLNGEKSATIRELLGHNGDGLINTFENMKMESLLNALGSTVNTESTVSDALFYKTNEEGEREARTVKEFTDSLASGDVMDLAGDVTLADALNVTAESSGFIKSLAYGSECKKDENGNYLTDTGDYIINEEGEIEVVSDRTLTTLKDLSEKDFIDEMKVSDLLEINENSPALLTSIQDWTIEDLNNKEKVNGLKIGSVIPETGNSTLLQAISDYTIGDISEGKIEKEVALSALLGEDAVKDNFVLKHLADSTIESLPTDILNLSVQQLFESDIYKTDENGNKNMVGTWKYMLTDYETGEVEDYTIENFNKMTENMQHNIQNASLQALYDDEILTLNQDTLQKQINYNGKTKVGDLTISELLDFVGSVVGN